MQFIIYYVYYEKEYYQIKIDLIKRNKYIIIRKRMLQILSLSTVHKPPKLRLSENRTDYKIVCVHEQLFVFYQVKEIEKSLLQFVLVIRNNVLFIISSYFTNKGKFTFKFFLEKYQLLNFFFIHFVTSPL